MRRLLDSHQQAQVSKGDAAFLNGLKDALVHESGLAHIGTQQYWEAVQVRHFGMSRVCQSCSTCAFLAAKWQCSGYNALTTGRCKAKLASISAIQGGHAG